MRNPLKFWWLPALVGVSALLIMASGEAASIPLRYQREAILSGEWWRLWSGHWVHLGWIHLWLNLAGLVLSWLLVGRAFSELAWLIFMALIPLFISLCLLFWLPELEWYVGLSGLLHGVLLAGALRLYWRGQGDALILVLLVVVKLVWDFWQGAEGTEAAIGGAVIVHAHLFGAIGGVLFVILHSLTRVLTSLTHRS